MTDEAQKSAITRLRNENIRMRDRIERLRGALKTASGWCFDMSDSPNADDPTGAEWLARSNSLLSLAGDMESPNE